MLPPVVHAVFPNTVGTAHVPLFVLICHDSSPKFRADAQQQRRPSMSKRLENFVADAAAPVCVRLVPRRTGIMEMAVTMVEARRRKQAAAAAGGSSSKSSSSVSAAVPAKQEAAV